MEREESSTLVEDSSDNEHEQEGEEEEEEGEQQDQEQKSNSELSEPKMRSIPSRKRRKGNDHVPVPQKGEKPDSKDLQVFKGKSDVWCTFRLWKKYNRAVCTHCNAHFAYGLSGIQSPPPRVNISSSFAETSLCLLHAAPTSNLIRHKEKCSGEPRKAVKAKQGPIDKFTVKAPQIVIVKLLTKLIVNKNLPIDIAEDKDFIEFVSALNPSILIPCKTVMTEKIDHLYNAVVFESKLLLKQASSVALTTDLATTIGTESMIAITAHFIDKNWKMVSLCISLGHVTERHTADSISSLVEVATTQWSLNAVALTTDSASNMLGAADNLKE